MITLRVLSQSTPAWRGSGHAPIYKTSRPTTRQPIALPTINQRFRVLELLTSLSPHHTKECTRNSQPLYAQQARERYAPLVGHKSPSQSSWLRAIGFGLNADDMDVSARVRGDLQAATGHKYF